MSARICFTEGENNRNNERGLSVLAALSYSGWKCKQEWLEWRSEKNVEKIGWHGPAKINCPEHKNKMTESFLAASREIIDTNRYIITTCPQTPLTLQQSGHTIASGAVFTAIVVQC